MFQLINKKGILLSSKYNNYVFACASYLNWIEWTKRSIIITVPNKSMLLYLHPETKLLEYIYSWIKINYKKKRKFTKIEI